MILVIYLDVHIQINTALCVDLQIKCLALSHIHEYQTSKYKENKILSLNGLAFCNVI